MNFKISFFLFFTVKVGPQNLANSGQCDLVAGDLSLQVPFTTLLLIHLLQLLVSKLLRSVFFALGRVGEVKLT